MPRLARAEAHIPHVRALVHAVQDLAQVHPIVK
jgi:hypothetical protein